MDLKDILQNFLKLDGNRRMDSRLLIACGVVGIAILAATAWLAIQDSQSGRVASQARSEGQLVIDQLARPVQTLKQVLWPDELWFQALYKD